MGEISRESAPVQREFCRRLFRLGGSDSASRHAWLDAISDAAIADKTAGRTLVSVGSMGSNSGFQIVNGWKPDDVLDIVNAARDWAGEDNVDDALALIAGPIRALHFECGLERGGFGGPI